MRDAPGDRSAWYRRLMVDALLASGEVSSPRVAGALSQVPREAFLPGAHPTRASGGSPSRIPRKDDPGDQHRAPTYRDLRAPPLRPLVPF